MRFGIARSLECRWIEVDYRVYCNSRTSINTNIILITIGDAKVQSLVLIVIVNSRSL